MINENSQDERINKEKIIDGFKISERINEYKDTYYKIRYGRTNILRRFIQEKNNKIKTDKDQKNEIVRNKRNFSKWNQKGLKEH